MAPSARSVLVSAVTTLDFASKQTAGLVDFVNAYHRRILRWLVVGLHEPRGRGRKADHDVVVRGGAPPAPMAVEVTASAMLTPNTLFISSSSGATRATLAELQAVRSRRAAVERTAIAVQEISWLRVRPVGGTSE